ncbi:protein of unknown function [Candidatus Methylomirabilis oxygeniifera]|uniref:Uncharacterized protein n=1 Tax=Methylomirabilis oxygeniifera TaxID=671143 RepID=D5MEY5_METO1|nr:protein of unknown function [Candidatus Methylomirabilis oxyfera]
MAQTGRWSTRLTDFCRRQGGDPPRRKRLSWPGLLGETGRGTTRATGVLGRIDIETGSLAKSPAGFGAYVVGNRTVIEYLINRARPFTAPSPSVGSVVSPDW